MIKTLEKQLMQLAIQAAIVGLLPISALATTFNLETATISDIDAAFNSGALTSKQLG